MIEHFGDRLVLAAREKNAPACVGLDPLLERFPAALLERHGITPGKEDAAEPAKAADALRAFGRGVIESIASHVPAIKINIAFFEKYLAPGVQAYLELVHHAQEAGLIVIGDVKRADIGHSSTRYAQAQLAALPPTAGALATPDAVTVNPYFGFDGVRPFVQIAREQGRGLFVLVQTSNESAASIQGLSLSDGSPLCHAVARLVQDWASDEPLVGSQGYSCVGAVVSPRDIESTVRIREIMPSCLFLVPGFGAQGRTADEVARCFKADGSGAIVTASRSVIYAYHEERHKTRFGDDWRKCIEQACKELVEALRGVLSP